MFGVFLCLKFRKMKEEEYIEERNKEFASNIDEFSIGNILLAKDKSNVTITNKTKNSVEVYIKAKTKNGANSKQWFIMNSFNREFKKI